MDLFEHDLMPDLISVSIDKIHDMIANLFLLMLV
jgi:hypothetical protein